MTNVSFPSVCLQVALKACQKQLAAAQQQVQQQQQQAQQQQADPSLLAKLHQLEGALRQASADYALLLGELAKIRGEAEARQAALASEKALQKGLKEEVQGLQAQLAAAGQAVQLEEMRMVGSRSGTGGGGADGGSGGSSRRVSRTGSTNAGKLLSRRESEEGTGLGRNQLRVMVDQKAASRAALAASRGGDGSMPGVQGADAVAGEGAAGGGEAGARYRRAPGDPGSGPGAAGMSSAELERRAASASRGARERIIPPTGFA
jgi:hypothetical protein